MRSMEEGRYYEAHEDLEVIWFPKRYDKSDEVRLWKGFINGAVSCELLRRGRTHPACRVWENYMKYRSILVTLESSYYEIYVKMDTLIQHRRKICLLS
jgi:hypothetical protein